MEPLALKYRPSTFSEMIGHRVNAVVLEKMVESDQVPQGLLFSGPSGTGKTTAARVLAGHLDAGDVLEVDAASHGGVADVRALVDTLRYAGSGAHRVVILDEAHSLSRDAFNSLLKILEEPPTGTIFVFVTTEPEKIPDTVLTRLMEFEFRRVPTPDILDRLVYVLRREDIDAEADLLQYIAERADGNVRSALMMLDQVRRAGVSQVTEYIDLLGVHDPAPALIAALMTNDPAHYFGVLDGQLAAGDAPNQIAADLTRCLRDLLVLRAGGSITASGIGLESRRDLALRLESERILWACRTLWDLKTRVKNSTDQRADLELAVVLIAEAFQRGKQEASMPVQPVPTPAQVPSTPRKLTLAEMQRTR